MVRAAQKIESRLSSSLVRQIVALANTAPSGDNCQPWRFHWKSQELHIFHDENRAKHTLNPGNWASVLTLGTLLESVRLSAERAGFLTHIKVSSFLPNERNSWAVVTFNPSPSLPSSLCDALEFRHSNRNPFSTAKLSDEFLSEVKHYSQTYENAAAWFCPPQRDLVNSISGAESVAWEIPSITQDLFHWIRWNPKLEEKDGMPYRSLGIKVWEKAAFQALRHEAIRRMALKMGFVNVYRKKIKRLINASGCLVCFTVSDVKAASIIEVGALALRTWLLANQSGYGVQPVSLSAFQFFFDALEKKKHIHNPFYSHFDRKTLLEKSFEAFGFPKRAIPIWLFRIGKAHTVPETYRAKRLNIEEIFLED